MQKLPEKELAETLVLSSDKILHTPTDTRRANHIPHQFRALPAFTTDSTRSSIDSEQILFALAILAEAEDPSIANHLKRIQLYMRVLMQQLQDHPDYRAVLTHEYQPIIAQAALLHDIGKMQLPTELKLKNGALSADEFNSMTEHTIHGKKALIQVERLDQRNNLLVFFAKQIIYSHHERWDGSGYPLGLRQQQIPIPARLMAFADVYDGLTSPKSYKSSLSHQEARDIILSDDASLFDPLIVKAFREAEAQFELIAKEFSTAID